MHPHQHPKPGLMALDLLTFRATHCLLEMSVVQHSARCLLGSTPASRCQTPPLCSDDKTFLQTLPDVLWYEKFSLFGGYHLGVSRWEPCSMGAWVPELTHSSRRLQFLIQTHLLTPVRELLPRIFFFCCFQASDKDNAVDLRSKVCLHATECQQEPC